MNRRGFLGGLLALVTAPALPKVPSLPWRSAAPVIVPIRFDPAELNAVVRRAYIPKVYADLWRSSPMLTALLAAQDNAK